MLANYVCPAGAFSQQTYCNLLVSAPTAGQTPSRVSRRYRSIAARPYPPLPHTRTPSSATGSRTSSAYFLMPQGASIKQNKKAPRPTSTRTQATPLHTHSATEAGAVGSNHHPSMSPRNTALKRRARWPAHTMYNPTHRPPPKRPARATPTSLPALSSPLLRVERFDGRIICLQRGGGVVYNPAYRHELAPPVPSRRVLHESMQ